MNDKRTFACIRGDNVKHHNVSALKCQSSAATGCKTRADEFFENSLEQVSSDCHQQLIAAVKLFSGSSGRRTWSIYNKWFCHRLRFMARHKKIPPEKPSFDTRQFLCRSLSRNFLSSFGCRKERERDRKKRDREREREIDRKNYNAIVKRASMTHWSRE